MANRVPYKEYPPRFCRYWDRPNMNGCGCQACPLDPDPQWHQTHPDDPDQKCRASKAHRLEVVEKLRAMGNPWLDDLAYGGLTGLEFAAQQRIQGMSDEERREFADRGRRALAAHRSKRADSASKKPPSARSGGSPVRKLNEKQKQAIQKYIPALLKRWCDVAENGETEIPCPICEGVPRGHCFECPVFGESMHKQRRHGDPVWYHCEEYMPNLPRSLYPTGDALLMDRPKPAILNPDGSVKKRATVDICREFGQQVVSIIEKLEAGR